MREKREKREIDGPLLASLAARSWAFGVLASYVFVVYAFCRTDRAVEAVGRGMVLGLFPALLGFGLASLAAMRALGRPDDPEQPEAGSASGRRARLRGALAVALLAVSTLVASWPLEKAAGPSPRSILLHPPALLVLAGATLLLARIAGRGDIWSHLAPALGLAGTFGCVAGLVQALLGFLGRDISRVTAGVSFLLTSGFVSLLAMLLLARAAPRDQGGAPRARTAHWLAWALLPLVALLHLVIAIVLVMTPMTAPG
jgi:hypothetical protein